MVFNDKKKTLYIPSLEKNIYDVLNMTVNKAMLFFRNLSSTAPNSFALSPKNRSKYASIGSTVAPGMSDTSALWAPTNRLRSVDFPALGAPMIATLPTTSWFGLTPFWYHSWLNRFS